METEMTIMNNIINIVSFVNSVRGDGDNKFVVYNMNNLQKRIALFLIGCIGTRTLLVYIAKHAPPTLLTYMGYIALFPAFGFFYLFLSGTRTTGAEVFGDKIWWNNLRPIHGILYAMFAYHAIHKHSNAWMYLLADVIIGLLSFLYFHYTQGHFIPLKI
jgi:hypothetical protein